jgi:putative ABC transport system permease protein
MSFADLHHDLLEALRGLRRAPVFTFVVTLTLAIGVGGALATISVMDRVLFRPPAGVSKPQELRRLYIEFRPQGRPNTFNRKLSYPDFEDLAEVGKGRASLSLYSAGLKPLGTGGPAVRVEFVGRGYFSLLGVRPFLGRFFTAEETRPSSPAVDPLVISTAFWHRQFGDDSAALGRTVILSGRSFMVVGIAQPDFRGMDLNPTDVWVPIGSVAPGTGEPFSFNDRGRGGWSVVARLERGAWPELLASYSTRLREVQYPPALADTAGRVVARPLIDPWGDVGRWVGERRNAALAVRLAFVATAVLVVAILHGAIMLSLRALHRRREIAIRLALGMPRRRLVLHHVLEAVGVAAMAGVFAVLLGWWGATVLDARVLSSLRPAAVVMDGRLITMALLLLLVALAVTGFVPALTSRAISPTALRAEGVAGDAGDGALRQYLVVAETAACVALVMLAALSLRSLQRIEKADFGFDGDRLIELSGPLGVDVSPLRERVLALPFVESASVGDYLSTASRTPFAIPERDPIPDSLAPRASIVANDYLRTAGARLLYGRTLAETDVVGGQRVVVITRSMAARFWTDANPLGKCVQVFRKGAPCRYVVGVIEDIRWGPEEPASPRYFVPNAQAGGEGSRLMLIRTRKPALATDAATIEQMARGEWVHNHPRATAMRLIDELRPRLAPLQAAATLFLIFGVLALVSAASGVYGLVSYLVSRRTREIGIRIALGASTCEVARVLAGWAFAPFVVGVGLGVFGAVAGGRLIAAFLFETAGYDPVMLGAAIAVVIIAALAAAVAPARRAVTLDPAASLRVE